MERIIDQRYVIEDELGSGAMGRVLQVFDTQLKRRVALKLLHSQTEESLIRFTREARAAARLQSEHVVRILDARVTTEGEAYIVMERLVGRDLSAVLWEHGALPAALAAEYLAQACDALEEAHQLGIVHRDIKPSNLFLASRHDGSKILKVLDFGISKSTVEEDTAGSQTAEFAIIGTPRYIAPERLQLSKNVDGRSDIWALGAVLYELLTDTPAFDATSSASLIAQIVATDAPEVKSKLPDVPDPLNDIVRRCLQRDPGRRFANAAELKHALMRCASPAATTTCAPASDEAATRRITTGTTHRVHIVDRPPPSPRRDRGRLRVSLLAITAVGALGLGWRLRHEQRAPAPPLESTSASSGSVDTVLQATEESLAPDDQAVGPTERSPERVVYDVDALPLAAPEPRSSGAAKTEKRSPNTRRVKPPPTQPRRSVGKTPPPRSPQAARHADDLFGDIE